MSNYSLNSPRIIDACENEQGPAPSFFDVFFITFFRFLGFNFCFFLRMCRRFIAFQPILSSRDWTALEDAAEVYQLIVVASMGRCQKPVDFGMPRGDP